MSTRPVIALLTDFGTHDHYVAAMKGVILSICPDATLIDITHEIPPQDITAGALELEAVAPYLPQGSVVIAVVDPGVGSGRRAVAVDTGTLTLVGPDNGLLMRAVPRHGEWRAVSLENRAYTRAEMSRTFEGRDRFAPVGAWLARGVPLSEMGAAVQDLVPSVVPEPIVSEAGVDGAVVRVDHFGNLVTNIPSAALAAAGPAPRMVVGDVQIDRIVRTYADAQEGGLCALVGSADRLEVAVRGGSAAVRLSLGVGAPVRVRRSGA